MKQLQLMAEYNQLMNQRILNAAGEMSDEALKKDKGAFFKSVFVSLNHIMIGDVLWLKRISSHAANFSCLKQLSAFEKPQRLDQVLFDDFNEFKQQRIKLDQLIIDWCNELNETNLSEALNYENFIGERHSKRLGDLILHIFLHQVHHRGQVTTLLSQEDIDFGETDLPEIIPEM